MFGRGVLRTGAKLEGQSVGDGLEGVLISTGGCPGAMGDWPVALSPNAGIVQFATKEYAWVSVNVMSSTTSSIILMTFDGVVL